MKLFSNYLTLVKWRINLKKYNITLYKGGMRMQQITFKPIDETDGIVRGILQTPIAGEDRVSPSGRKYPCVVICPGGGYEMVSDCEADPVAREYLGAGYQVFILSYSIKEDASNFVPLMELSHTIMKIREHAEEWDCIEDQIAVLGFSAGGHLACSLATLWSHEALKSKMDTKNGRNRPNAAILAYPVITANEFAHEHSIQRVSGALKGTDEYAFFSLENHVNADTCNMFLWHTVNDTCVPVENSLLLSMALSRNKIPFECHLFPEGAHGLSVCTTETRTPHPYNRIWVELSIRWLNREFNYII